MRECKSRTSVTSNLQQGVSGVSGEHRETGLRTAWMKRRECIAWERRRVAAYFILNVCRDMELGNYSAWYPSYNGKRVDN